MNGVLVGNQSSWRETNYTSHLIDSSDGDARDMGARAQSYSDISARIKSTLE